VRQQRVDAGDPSRDVEDDPDVQRSVDVEAVVARQGREVEPIAAGDADEGIAVHHGVRLRVRGGRGGARCAQLGVGDLEELSDADEIGVGEVVGLGQRADAGAMPHRYGAEGVAGVDHVGAGDDSSWNRGGGGAHGGSGKTCAGRHGRVPW